MTSNSTPTLLVVGATGNTGRGVIETVSKELKDSEYKGFRIIGTTRDTSSSTSKELAKQPGVEMVEKDWTMIDAKWLTEHAVKRVFIASHNNASHFTDESLFLNAALTAEVEYVVRICTTAANVGPTTSVFYGRAHWGIETMLEQPEFGAMKWTSLRPNVFNSVVAYPGVEWIQHYKKTGEKRAFKCMLDGDAPAAVIDPNEIGIIAGKLLLQKDVSKHASKKYILAGPSNITGKQITALVEKYAKTSVEETVYRDISWLEPMEAAGYPKNLLASLGTAPAAGYEGALSVENTPTSPEIMELYAPKHHSVDEIEKILASV